MEQLYHYTECGLDDVYIHNMPPVIDDDGDEVYHIPYIHLLHKQISIDLVETRQGLSGNDIKFLRTELGLTQAELARYVQKDAQTIGRWERDEHPIDAMADFAIRALVLTELGVKIVPEALSRLCVASAQNQKIDILFNGNDPDNPYASFNDKQAA